MKLHFRLLAVLVLTLFLSGCIFPVQHVSPDPRIHGSDLSDSSDAAVYTLPDAEPTSAPALESDISSGTPAGITEPKLAIFWYAMADAHVFELRNAFSPELDASGIPYREYDAENDRYRQLDQIREAVRGGWNILAVQLVSEDPGITQEIIDAADGCPVLFFDRTPKTGLFSSLSSDQKKNVCIICTDPMEAGRVQGQMIGEYLTAHFTTADLNQDGRIRYTFLVGDANDPVALALTHAALDTANAILAEEGYRALEYLDEENTIGFQADPNGTWSSDAGTSLILSDLSYYNYTNSNMIELIAANNDDMALGALTALQSAWCNLGDGTSVTIPLFGLGASSSARSAVNLGQMTGTVDGNATGYAQAVLAAVSGLSEGHTPESIFSQLSASSADFSSEADTPSVLFVSPRAVLTNAF